MSGTYYGARPWSPDPHEFECDECGCYSPRGEDCWQCALTIPIDRDKLDSIEDPPAL